jgi:hypothetical protein
MADSESDLWMHTGCAVRMAYDLGLHLVGLGTSLIDHVGK